MTALFRVAVAVVIAGNKFDKGGEKLKSVPVPYQTMNQLGIDLITYRVTKQASTCISPFFMMYGREPILPWEVEHDLGPLESVDVPGLSLDEVIERMYNL